MSGKLLIIKLVFKVGFLYSNQPTFNYQYSSRHDINPLLLLSEIDPYSEVREL